MTTLNLCAALQTDLARLGPARYLVASGVEDAPVPEAVASGAVDLYIATCARLQRVGAALEWVHPSLVRSLLSVLVDFPLADAYRACGRDVEDARIIVDSVREEAASLTDLAAGLDRRGSTQTLLALARLVRTSARHGVVRDAPILHELAQLLDDGSSRAQVLGELNAWASRTHHHEGITELRELIGVCPAARHAQAILADFIERQEDLVYAPFVFDAAQLGVAVPIAIRADFACAADDPTFQLLRDPDGDYPEWLTVAPNFRAAVLRGRERAGQMLAYFGCRPDPANFAVRLGLPDLRIGPQVVTYDQGSIELPVALALFCQHPKMRSVVALNPEVAATGPILAETLDLKAQAGETVGGVAGLLAISEQQVRPSPPRVWMLWPANHKAITRRYLPSDDWDALREGHANVVTFGTHRAWDEPLGQGRAGAGRVPPLLPVKRHRKAVSTLLQAHAAGQLRGLAGIGKTWLLGQWLRDVRRTYDVVVYTSVPEFSNDAATSGKWAIGALQQMASRLADRWGRDGLLKTFNARPDLIADPEELAETLRDELGPLRLLWVIDDGQYLLDEDGRLVDERIAAIVNHVGGGHWPDAKLLFVTNRKLVKPLLAEHHLDDGFTPEEAREYLDGAAWRFPETRDAVADALGGHPRALALIAGYATDYRVHPAEIYEILDTLPSEAGSSELKVLVCRKILDHIVRTLETRQRPTWWTLLAISAFIDSFDLSQARGVLRAVRDEVNDGETEHLDTLELRSLALWNDQARRWSLHGLVRGYAQELLRGRFPARYKDVHRLAGELYFPLSKNRRLITQPRGTARSKYADAAGCATALYHFEAAGYEPGQQAIIENHYEHVIPRAVWWMEHGRQPTNPCAGYARAETLLRGVLRAYRDPEDGFQHRLDAAPSHIHRLLAKALAFQRNPAKYEEAAARYREARSRGDLEVTAELVCVLCDMANGTSAHDPLWREAEGLFEEVSREVRHRSRTVRYQRLGEAYEKMARRYLSLDPPDSDHALALIVVEEAAEAGVRWDGIYLVGAEIAARAGDEAAMERWLMKGLTLVPQSSRLWSRLYLLKAKQKRLNAIPRAWFYHPRGIQSSLSLSRQLLEEGFANEARQCLDDALKIYGDNDDLWYVRARLESDTLKRKDVLRRALSSVSSVKLLTELGRLHESEQEWEAAERTYREAIKTRRVDSTGYIALARLQLARGQSDEALSTLQDGIRATPRDAQVLVVLGELCEQRGEPAEAESYYRQAMTVAPTYGASYALLGKLQQREGKEVDALLTLEDGCRSAPQDGAASIALAEFWEQHDDPAKAETYYRRAIDAAPTYGVPYAMLAKLQQGQGKHDDALFTLEEGCRRAAQDAPLAVALARVWEQREDSAKAETYYRQAIGAAPTYVLPYILLAKLQQGQGKHDDALITLENGRRRARQYAPLAIALAEHWEQRGEQVEAETYCRQAIAAAPTFGTSYTLLAKLQQAQGKHDEAIVTLEDGCRRAPQNALPPIALAQLWEQRGDQAKAETHYRQAIAAAPTFGMSYTELAKLQQAQGKHDEAIVTLEDGCRRASQDALPPIALAQLWEQRGAQAKAETYYRQAIAASPAFGMSYALLAKLQQDQGKHADALLTLEDGRRRARQDALPAIAFGQLWEQLDESAKAET